jgi:hypothetical protein
MKIYHGSYTAIHEIDLTKCKPKRDLLTDFKESAFLADKYFRLTGEKNRRFRISSQTI